MSGPVVSLLVFLLAGASASAWLLRVRMRRDRRETGLRALSGMHWREFQRLMVEALRRRGHERAPGAEAGDHEGLVELRREGRTWLLSAKHGAGYVPGLSAINAFANALRLRGAAGGCMTTLGALPPETVSQARLHGIELLDGIGVWDAIEPVLEPAQREAIVGDARRRAMRALALAWALAAIAGVAVFALAGRQPTTAAAPATDAAHDPARPAPAPNPATPAPAPAQAQAGALPEERVPDDPEELLERRRGLATAVTTLPWVDRALWSTQSTLVVHLAGDAIDRDALCGLVARHAELRTSRLQLQPPRGSDRPVRFIQCRTF